MDRLSSCYFCGAAVDAPLDEYPVVPEEIDPDPERQAAVTLCPTCRRKLADLMDRVVDAASAPRRQAGAAEEPAEPAGDAAEEADTESPDDRDADPTPLSGMTPDATPGGDADADSDPLDDVSVQSYNRVARLLRNREFPIDRGELRAIATSAYDMSAAEFDAVVDAAIERGQLADEDGTLVRPEG